MTSSMWIPALALHSQVSTENAIAALPDLLFFLMSSSVDNLSNQVLPTFGFLSVFLFLFFWHLREQQQTILLELMPDYSIIIFRIQSW